jgi:DNA-binding MarR family transcriptional regulator
MGARYDRSLSRAVAIRRRAARDRAETASRLPVKHSQTERIVRHWHEAVPNDRLAHLVKDASRAFVRALQSRLARHQVPFGQWTFLRILWESDGLTQRELSAEAGVMEPTTHVALNAMERLGYIRRRRLAADRRNVYVHLTAKGRALKAKLVPLAEEVNEVGVDGIDIADVATTRRVLIAIIDNLAKNDITAGVEAPKQRSRANAS